MQDSVTVHQDSYIVLTGDGKTYEHLMEVKRLYGSALNKLLIFPGDWHTLANFQPVLMKIYYHAGLKEIAQCSGYKGETLTSLERCSNFKRTHRFLLQVWEAMYRAMINAFNTNNQNLDEVIIIHPHMTTSSMLESIHLCVEDAGTQCSFQLYVSSMSARDDTWKFWQQFVFQDCLAYLQLYLSIRCQNWDLRVSGLKQMAPLFIAYDRTTYQRLIPNHLADIQIYPQKILNCLKKGFTRDMQSRSTKHTRCASIRI